MTAVARAWVLTRAAVTASGVPLDRLGDQQPVGQGQAWPPASAGPFGGPEQAERLARVAGQAIGAQQDRPHGSAGSDTLQ